MPNLAWYWWLLIAFVVFTLLTYLGSQTLVPRD